MTPKEILQAFTARFPEELKEKLKRVARARGMSENSLLMELVERLPEGEYASKDELDQLADRVKSLEEKIQ